MSARKVSRTTVSLLTASIAILSATAILLASLFFIAPAPTAQAQPSKVFSWGIKHVGDCTRAWAYLSLRPDGTGTYSAYITSTSSNDSWGVKGLTLKDANGTPLYTIGDLWSPTLPRGDPNVASTEPTWTTRVTFPVYIYNYIASVSASAHC